MRAAALRAPGGRWLILAGLAAALAALLTLRSAAGAEPIGAVVVAREPLPAGLVLDEATAARALVAVPLSAGAGLVGVFADPAAVVGRRIASGVGPGEPLTEAALGGTGAVAPLSPGERAVAVPLAAAGGAAAGLVPGSRVDVIASTGEGAAGRTAVVVPDADVLVVASAPGADGAAGAGDVLLRVSPAQALRITAAVNFAREVRLLVRPPGEGGAVPPPVAAPAP